MLMFSFMYLSGVLYFSFKRKHLLLMLLSLEFMIISLFLGLSLYFYNFSYEEFFLMIFLTFSVCESALGLSILVSLMRVYGNDYFSTFNLLW
uniref:NADH-ubiquinone oxidoreductase chain 4L n=1 Tax=Stegobium paniceum TaxID=295656 RepID=A0A343C0X8_STEPN|nr:NADH dehydrogenase subunit 4L [Stegobium paniceum]ARH10879.1 NADH dehydrogenase subunit 4L [Stegobium paniceum]QCI56378.1 NADH dehydrogenase subunit 4L [Stegobium paniceum]QDH12154.1 NADH dehydrogenase subunit 4L [Stegobium paniceum]